MKAVASLLFWLVAPTLAFLACTRPTKHPNPAPPPPDDASAPVSTP